jgi:hypothetical protein
MAEILKLSTSVDQSTRLRRINELWEGLSGNYVDTIIKVGAELRAEQHERGDESLVAMADRLPFAQPWISAFIAISENPIIRNASSRIKFPPDYTIIAMLNRLPHDILSTKLQDGSIHPKLTRAEAKAMQPPKPEAGKRPESARTRLLALFKKAGRKGMTADEASAALPDIHTHTVTSATNGLKQDAFLVDTGERRPTRAKGYRKATVYRYQKQPKIDYDKLSEAKADEMAEFEHDIDPRNYQKAFLLRVDTAEKLAFYNEEIKQSNKRREFCALARRVAARWSALADAIETRGVKP